MGAITVSGKGSRSRVRDRKRFRDNFDEIDFTKRADTASVVRIQQLGAKIRYTYGAGACRLRNQGDTD